MPSKSPPKSTWKGLESRVCKKFLGTRTPLSGSNSQHGTSADCMNCAILPNVYIEIKSRSELYTHALFKDAAAKAKKEGKLPLLVTHQKNDKGELVTLRLSDFLGLIKNDNQTASISVHDPGD